LAYKFDDARYIGPAVLGIIMAVISRIIASKSKFKNWRETKAKCIDYEIAKFNVRSKVRDQSSEPKWLIRFICEYHDGITSIHVTPEIYDYWDTEQLALEYFEQHITGDGHCTIWVSPNNPLLTRLSKEVPILQTQSI